MGCGGCGKGGSMQMATPTGMQVQETIMITKADNGGIVITTNLRKPGESPVVQMERKMLVATTLSDALEQVKCPLKRMFEEPCEDDK
jgi:hypothetical protein